MSIVFPFLVTMVGAYVVGAIPTGFLIARMRGIADIRKHGSGNIGATNVSRMLGIIYFFIVFFLDSLKAFLFLKLLAYCGVTELVQVLAACLVLVGNVFSVFLCFSGGKGVATAVGIVAALSPYLVLFVPFPWAILLLATKTMGVASVGAALTLPFFSLLIHEGRVLFFLSLFIAFWVTNRHVPNVCDYFGARMRN